MAVFSRFACGEGIPNVMSIGRQADRSRTPARNLMNTTKIRRSRTWW